MKRIDMAAEVSGKPQYLTSMICHTVLLQHTHPEHVADHFVSEFIRCLYISTGFWHSKVTFTLTTHEGAHVHRLVQYFDEEGGEDLAKFWIPVVTKYISEN